MDWVFYKRRGPEWKQGWTGQTMASVSTPPLHLLTIFAIVILLLSLSNYTGYKARLEQTATNFQLFLFLLPILLIFSMGSTCFSADGRSWFRLPRPEHDSIHRARCSPWGVAILVVVLLVLVSYQSSFHSKWFGPLWKSHY